MVRYSNEQLLEALRECKEKHGKINTAVLNSDDNLPSGPTYSYRFDSLHDAAERAGLDDEAYKLRDNQRRRQGYDEDYIIDYIQGLSVDGRVTPKMIRDDGGPSSTAVKNCFEVDSILSVDIDEVDVVSSLDKPSREELDSMVRDMDNNNEYVTRSDIRDVTKMSYVKEYYGSLSNMCDELDVTTYSDYRSSRPDIFAGDMYVYCIELDDAFYVGRTGNVVNRMRSHISNRDDFVSVERVVDVSDSDDWSDCERELLMEIAREYETTSVYGGK